MQRYGARSLFTASRMLRADALKVTFATPTDIILDGVDTYMVSCVTVDGETSILADHAAYLGELKPGYVSVFETEKSDAVKYFVPGGFIVQNEDSKTTISAAEAIPVDDIDMVAVKNALTAAEADLAKAGVDELAAADAQILIDVYSAMLSEQQ